LTPGQKSGANKKNLLVERITIRKTETLIIHLTSSLERNVRGTENTAILIDRIIEVIGVEARIVNRLGKIEGNHFDSPIG